MFKKIKKTNSGYSLLETVFYVALFAILSIALLQVMINMTGAFMETIITRNLMQGSSIMENISRELRQASNFVLNGNQTILTIKTNGSTKTVTYTYASPNITVQDSILGNLGNLNTPNVSVTSFSITPLSTPKSQAARISLTVRANSDATGQSSADFKNTVVLRGDY
jgi:type II secretory pathway pseudopilin PulG